MKSTIASSTPVTVTVWGTPAFAGVKTSSETETVASVGSDEATGMTTSAVGIAVRTTVNVTVQPPSVVYVADGGLTTIPIASSIVSVYTAGRPDRGVRRRPEGQDDRLVRLDRPRRRRP